MPANGLPRRRGYGSELIERALRYQLEARTMLEFGPDGAHCSIAVPITAGEDTAGEDTAGEDTAGEDTASEDPAEDGASRSEEAHGGKEGVSTGRSRWSPEHKKNK